MPCRTIYDNDGKPIGIACSRGKAPQRCVYCKNPSTKLCDFPVGNGTCDKPMCDAHSRHVGPDHDYCQHHPVSPELIFG